MNTFAVTFDIKRKWSAGEKQLIGDFANNKGFAFACNKGATELEATTLQGDGAATQNATYKLYEHLEHIAIVCDGTNLTTYINNAQVGQKPAIGIAPDTVVKFFRSFAGATLSNVYLWYGDDYTNFDKEADFTEYLSRLPKYITNAEVFLVAGSTNAVGRPAGSYAAGDEIPNNVYQVSRVGSYSKMTQDYRIIPARYALDNVNPIDDASSGKSGFWLEFVRQYAIDNPTKNVVLIPAGYGSSNFANNWATDKPLYTETIQRIQTVLSQNPTFTVKAILWHSGEHEYNALDLENGLTSLANGLRTAIGQNVPFINAGMPQSWVSANNRQGIQDKINDVPEYVQNSVFVNTALPTVLPNVSDRFNVAGYKELGVRYYNAYKLINMYDLTAQKQYIPKFYNVARDNSLRDNRNATTATSVNVTGTTKTNRGIKVEGYNAYFDTGYTGMQSDFTAIATITFLDAVTRDQMFFSTCNVATAGIAVFYDKAAGRIAATCRDATGSVVANVTVTPTTMLGTIVVAVTYSVASGELKLIIGGESEAVVPWTNAAAHEFPLRVYNGYDATVFNTDYQLNSFTVYNTVKSKAFIDAYTQNTQATFVKTPGSSNDTQDFINFLATHKNIYLLDTTYNIDVNQVEIGSDVTIEGVI